MMCAHSNMLDDGHIFQFALANLRAFARRQTDGQTDALTFAQPSTQRQSGAASACAPASPAGAAQAGPAADARHRRLCVLFVCVNVFLRTRAAVAEVCCPAAAATDDSAAKMAQNFVSTQASAGTMEQASKQAQAATCVSERAFAAAAASTAMAELKISESAQVS